MARGWESKSVEQQIEDAREGRNTSGARRMTPAEIERRQKREGLLLERSRILREMESARNPRYRALLDEMLRHLDSRLSSR